MDETDVSRHRQAWDLIPWVVNGSARAAERRVALAHVAACDDCRAELAFQQRLHDGLDDGAAPHDPGPALQRFWDRVDAAEISVSETSTPPRPQAQRERWVRWLAAAVVLQAIGLAVLGGVLWERPRAAGYETLSQAPPAARAAASVRLVPAPSLTIGELRALLERAGVQVADSSADGAILGLVPRVGTPGAPVSNAEAVARLRAEPGVLLVEPIGAAAQR